MSTRTVRANAAAPMASAVMSTSEMTAPIMAAAIESGATVESGSAAPVATVSVSAPSTPSSVADEGPRADRAVVTGSDARTHDRYGQADSDVHATSLGSGSVEAGAKSDRRSKGQSSKCSHVGYSFKKESE
jgi:hypothetical protein